MHWSSLIVPARSTAPVSTTEIIRGRNGTARPVVKRGSFQAPPAELAGTDPGGERDPLGRGDHQLPATW